MNPRLDTLTNVNGLVAATSFLVAFVVLVRAYRLGAPKQAGLWAVGALFAAFYVVAYLYLTFSDVNPLAWSKVMRGFAPPATWSMWIGAPWLATRLWQNLKREIKVIDDSHSSDSAGEDHE